MLLQFMQTERLSLAEVWIHYILNFKINLNDIILKSTHTHTHTHTTQNIYTVRRYTNLT